MSKLTIVIPVFNAVTTVERAIDSVLRSTIPIDIVIVDDGSTDGTHELLDGIANKYYAKSHLSVIHQTNTGPYQARLNGLHGIKTKYFGFVDADDTVEPDMYESMLKCAEEGDFDVVQCNHYEFSDLRTYVENVLLKGVCSSFVWDKIYRNQYDISSFAKLGKVVNFEDLILNWQFFQKIKSMKFMRNCFYHYNEVPTSAVHVFKMSKLVDYMQCCKFRLTMSSEYGICRFGWYNIRWMIKNAKNLVVFAVKSLVRKVI